MLSHRRMNILDYLNERGSATVQELVENFGISKATVNRDLTVMENEEKLVRVLGGAVSNKLKLTYEPEHYQKEKSQKEFKDLIGLKALDLINNGDIVILDSGTTTLSLARSLSKNNMMNKITVVTCDLKIASEISESSNLELILLGGILRDGFFSLSGHLTELCLDNINADIAFLGADAIDLKRGVSNANFSESKVKQKMIEAAKKTVLLTDSTKFGSTKMAKVCNISDLDAIITDSRISEDELNRYKQICKEIYVVDRSK